MPSNVSFYSFARPKEGGEEEKVLPDRHDSGPRGPAAGGSDFLVCSVLCCLLRWPPSCFLRGSHQNTKAVACSHRGSPCTKTGNKQANRTEPSRNQLSSGVAARSCPRSLHVSRAVLAEGAAGEAASFVAVISLLNARMGAVGSQRNF